MMMTTLLISVCYLLVPALIILLYKKFGWARKIGTVMLAYAVGIAASLFGWLDFSDPALTAQVQTSQTWIRDIAIMLAIPLMLFNCDFRMWTKSLPKTAAALVGGLIAIVVAVVSGFFVFRHSGIADLPNVAGMMTAIYTGGTMNFSALGAALKVNPNTISLVLTFEMLVTFPFIVFIVAGGYKVFRKLLPFADESVSVEHHGTVDSGVEQYDGMLKPRVFGRTLLALLLAIALFGVGALLSKLLTGKFTNELVIILTTTTLSIALSFVKKVRELPKTFELGMFFILVFSIIVASQFDVHAIDASAISLLLFLLYIIVVSVLLHFLLCRIFKVNGDLFCVANVGLLCSPPFVPPVVGAMGNKKVLISGICIGLIGYAAGTYLGAAMAYFLAMFL